jgi:hypothetical protein
MEVSNNGNACNINATAKKHPSWLFNDHDEHCTEENDAIFS